MAAVGFFDVVSGVPTFTQVQLINITLVFEKYEQTVKICIPKITRVCDLLKILGVKNWMAIDVKESPFLRKKYFCCCLIRIFVIMPFTLWNRSPN